MPYRNPSLDQLEALVTARPLTSFECGKARAAAHVGGPGEKRRADAVLKASEKQWVKFREEHGDDAVPPTPTPSTRSAYQQGAARARAAAQRVAGGVGLPPDPRKNSEA